MGHGMAKHAMAAGHPLTVIAHSNRKPVEDLVAGGATEAKNYAELAAASDIIIMCVSNSDVVEDAVLGDDGLLANANPGTVFIDTSTSYPARTRSLNHQVRDAGCLMADAPLSRTPEKAEQGQLATYVSCEQELYDRIKPILETYCELVIYLGEEVGIAHEVKLINNFIAMSMISTWSEAYNTCIARGIDPKGLHEAVSSGGLNNLNFQNYSKFILDGNPNGHKFSIANCRKDIAYYVKLAQESGLNTMMADPTLQMFTLAVARGYGDDYATIMPKIIGELNNTPAAELPRGEQE